MNTIPQYCQKCRERNDLGEPTCRKCGTRLMLVVFPHSLKYDTNHVPSYYEDHLLERVTTLELRLSQITERLAATLDLMLRQTKTAHSDHLLLETLIESLNSIGALEKENLTKNWQRRMIEDEIHDAATKSREKLIGRILKAHPPENTQLFEHLVREGVKLLSESQEKQAFLTFERALLISPANAPLLLLLGEKLFRSDKHEEALIYLQKGLIETPNNRKLKVLSAIIHTDLKDFETAKKILSSLTSKRNSTFCQGFLRGIISAVEENWGETLSAFKDVLIANENPETNYLTACVYFQLGKKKAAIRHLRKAVGEDVNFADAWFMLSVVHKSENNDELARQAIESAWQAKEAGAQCWEFLKSKKDEKVETALPFLRLKHSRKRLLSALSPRLNKMFRTELDKILN